MADPLEDWYSDAAIDLDSPDDDLDEADCPRLVCLRTQMDFFGTCPVKQSTDIEMVEAFLDCNVEQFIPPVMRNHTHPKHMPHLVCTSGDDASEDDEVCPFF